MAQLGKCPELHYTPKDICELLLKDIDFKPDEEALEPCIGRDRNFYDQIPFTKDWGEIELGRDIFTYDYGRLFHKVIVNPPYKTNHIDKKERKNIFIDFIYRSLELCADECWCLFNIKMLNSMTPIRLKKINEMGFGIISIKVINISKWFGRYFWICFKKGATSILQY